MKNLYLYLLLPAILLVAFLFTPSVGYFAAQDRITAREVARAEELARQKAAEEAKRAEIQKRAEEDALKRQKEHEEEERAKEEKRRRDYEDAINKLKEDIATFTNDSDTYTKELGALGKKLAQLRDQKEAENLENLELSKQVELAKIERRNADLEIQRMVAMVAEKLSSSPLLAPPPPPPTTKGK